MWHRLPYAQKRRPTGVGYERGRRAAAPRRRGDPRRRATLGADRGGDPFGWDNEFARTRVDVAGVRDRRVRRHQRRFPRVHRRPVATPIASSGPTPDGSGASSRARRIRRSGIAAAGAGSGAAMFEDIPLPLGWPVYVSHAEAAAFARWSGDGCRPRPSSIARRSERPRCDERAFPWGDEPPDAPRGNLRFPAWDPRPGRVVSRRRQRLGCPRSRRQRLGMDVDGVRAFPGLRADAVVSRVLGRLLRRPALRHEGCLAGDRRELVRRELPQLVPAALSLVLRHVPLQRW